MVFMGHDYGQVDNYANDTQLDIVEVEKCNKMSKCDINESFISSLLIQFISISFHRPTWNLNSCRIIYIKNSSSESTHSHKPNTSKGIARGKKENILRQGMKAYYKTNEDYCSKVSRLGVVPHPFRTIFLSWQVPLSIPAGGAWDAFFEGNKFV